MKKFELNQILNTDIAVCVRVFFFYLNQSEIPLSERIIALISTNDEFWEFKVESMFNTINENYL